MPSRWPPTKPMFPQGAGKFRFFIDDDGLVVSEDSGRKYDPMEAAQPLPWVDMTCPFMPHQYVVKQRSPAQRFAILEAAIAQHPAGYDGYFRGYRSPNHYWDAPDGRRYWQTAARQRQGLTIMLNRCDQTFEPPRRVDQGAKPAKKWDGPPWAPSGNGIYTLRVDGKWWPREGTIAPCRACQQNPPPEA